MKLMDRFGYTGSATNIMFKCKIHFIIQYKRPLFICRYYTNM